MVVRVVRVVLGVRGARRLGGALCRVRAPRAPALRRAALALRQLRARCHTQ